MPINYVSNTGNNTGNTVSVTNTNIINNYPGGATGQLQYNNNGQFAGTPTVAWSANGNSVVISTTAYGNGNNVSRVGSLYFRDFFLSGYPSASINFKAGGRTSSPGFMISPWQNPTTSPARQDGGLGIWRNPQSSNTFRTQTTINGNDTGPGIHGVYVADGAVDFNPDYPVGNTVGLSYIILPATFNDGTDKRYVGQISVNAYKTPGTPQWSLGWKQSNITPTGDNERAPGNRNIIWDSNNRVSINEANLTESFNVKGNIRIQPTGANADSGILFPDGTFQSTAAGGGNGGVNVLVLDEGNILTSALRSLNFVGNGITASAVSNGNIQVSVNSYSGMNVSLGNTVVQNVKSLIFDGNGVAVSNTGGTNSATVTITKGLTGISVSSEGYPIIPSTTAFNFVGTGVTTSNVAGVATVNIPSGIAGIAVQDEGTNVIAVARTINFTGNGVTASNVNGIATVNVVTSSGVTIKDEGLNVVPSAGTINFTGNGVTTTNIGGVATVDIPGRIAGITVQEEGTNIIASANTINFVGSIVTASNAGGVATVTVSAGGANTQVQFNDSGTFNGNAGLTFNKTTTRLTANNFVATSSANLGAVGNVTITGGSTGQVLTTDGSGHLSWTSAGGGNASLPIANGTSNINIPVVNGNITFGINGTANAVTFGNLGQVTAGNITTTGTGLSTITSNSDINLITASSGAVNITGGLSTSGNVDFFGPNVSLGDVANLHVTGGTSGQAIITDGNGNLSWGDAGGGGTPAGSNTQVQYNSDGVFGATLGFTFDENTGWLSAPGNISALSEIHFGDETGGVEDAWGRIRMFGNATPAYGFTYQDTGTIPTPHLAITNEQSTWNQALIIADGLQGASGTALGFSVINKAPNSSPTTGYEAGWVPLMEVDYYGNFKLSGSSNISNVHIPNSGTANVGGLISRGVSNLNSVSNVIITGGSSGQVLTTNGSGNLSWTTVTGISGITVKDEGTSILTSANTINFVGAGVVASNVGNVATITISGGGTPGGSDTQLQYNNNGVFGGIPNVTYSGGNLNLGNVSNVKVAGGINGYYLQTDGSGNLTWATGSNYSGNGTVAGSNTQIQFNNAGNFGAHAGFTFNSDTTTLNANNIVVTNIVATQTANLGFASNVTILGGSNNYVLKTDGFGNLSWGAEAGSPSGPNLSVQINAGNGEFYGDGDFIYDTNNNLVIIGHFNPGGLDPLGENTSLLVQGSLIVGEKDPGSAYYEMGRVRYLDDVGFQPGSYANVYGFTSVGTGTTMENWMAMVNEPGHESSTSTSIVLGQSQTDGNVTVFGVSVNDDAKNSVNDVFSDPFKDGWTQLLNLTGNNLFLPRLSEANANAVLVYDTSNGRVTYSNVGNINSGINVQEEGNTVVTSANTINFVGSAVTASNVGGVATITIDTGNSYYGGYYLHTQASANTVWTVNHNLNRKYVAVEPVDATGNSYTGRYDFPKIHYINANSLTMTWSSAINGYAAVVGGGVNTLTGVDIQDEGTNVVSNASVINFVGAGVTASDVDGVATVTIPGGGGGGGDVVYNKGAVSGNTTINISDGTIQLCLLEANTYFDISSVTSGNSITLLLTQGVANSFATYSGNVLWAVGYKTLSNVLGAVDMVNMVNIDGTYYATLTTGYQA